MASEAPGLLSCPELASNIAECQRRYGKKVLLSVGGADGNIMFESEQEAKDFGDTLWGLFGPMGGEGASVDVGLRPFGEVEVDGFDVGEFVPFLQRRDRWVAADGVKMN